MRNQWIESIKSHQEFNSIDNATIRFNVCNKHFRSEDITNSGSRVLVRSHPTIFPQINIELQRMNVTAVDRHNPDQEPVEW